MTEQMDIAEFGKELIRTQDLDPVYSALAKMALTDKQLARWLVAYWCFYHCGVASQLSESPEADFWFKMFEAANNKGNQFPRGRERRHYRAKIAVDSVLELGTMYPTASAFLDALISPTFGEVATKVQQHKAFGPWIAWKVADMIDRLIQPVDFSGADLSMYSEPVKAACMLFPLSSPQRAVAAAVDHLSKALAAEKAPPHGDRQVNIQEIETVLCKWKAHAHGRYPVGTDTTEILHGLDGWGDTATEFKQALLLC